MSKIAIDFKTGLIKNTAKIVAGIDLGTTNSLIAKINDGKPEIIKDIHGEALFIPSVIFVNENGEIQIGKKALINLGSNPKSTIYSVKRLMGKSLQDNSIKKENFGYSLENGASDNLIKIRINDKIYTPIELSSFILKHLVDEAQKSLGAQISDVVITVPAYFNDEQRQATRDAGRLAGLNVLRIINEPTAASLAYGIGLNQEGSKIVAVYDLGGGTFDISILRIEDGVFDVLATRGDTNLGGDDFDQLIVHYWAQKYPELNILQSDLRNDLRVIAEKAKIRVCSGFNFKLNWQNIHLSLNKVEFDELSNGLVSKTIDCCRSAIEDCKLTLEEIDEVLLVGGSSRMPVVSDSIEKLFLKKPNISLNPDEAVALGAAIQADILSGNRKDFLLLDIIPLSLGIETLGGLMDIIIPRNSKIPINLAREYTTSKDGQVNLKISIFQGERDLVENNKFLGEFILQNIPPMPAGIPKIRVHFMIDADGILIVKASELRTNTEQEIVIKSHFKLSPEEVAKMLMDSVHFAKMDMEKKSLIDTINEAKSILTACVKFITSNSKFIPNESLQKINTLCTILEGAIQKADKNLIQNSIDAINEFTTPLAHEALNRNIRSALTDTKIFGNIQKDIE